jgi:hypothetical protein
MNITPLVDKIFTLAIKSEIASNAGLTKMAYEFEYELYEIIADTNTEERQMYTKLYKAWDESGLMTSDLTVSEIKKAIINKVSNG